MYAACFIVRAAFQRVKRSATERYSRDAPRARETQGATFSSFVRSNRCLNFRPSSAIHRSAFRRSFPKIEKPRSFKSDRSIDICIVLS